MEDKGIPIKMKLIKNSSLYISMNPWKYCDIHDVS